MPIRQKNKISVNFSTIGMTDVIFNLLIFFMLTSTLVHPTAVKLLLPRGSEQVSAKPMTTVSITADLQHYVETQPVAFEDLENVLRQKLGEDPETYISLHVDRSVPTENLVNVLSIAQKNNYRLIIATSSR
jgi:biopolymer transport protein ExbD